MSAQRPRRPRRPSAVELHLAAWARLVRRAESRRQPPFDCPCCNGEDGLDARDRLEAVIRRGGTQGRRVSASVLPLDLRFEAATLGATRRSAGGGWWHGREWR